jgi:hypothetical protein
MPVVNRSHDSIASLLASGLIVSKVRKADFPDNPRGRHMVSD